MQIVLEASPDLTGGKTYFDHSFDNQADTDFSTVNVPTEALDALIWYFCFLGSFLFSDSYLNFFLLSLSVSVSRQKVRFTPRRQP